MKRCLYCYEVLGGSEMDFHQRCSKKMFGQPIPPELPYTEEKMEQLATKIIQSNATVTGVQPKLSLHTAKESGKKAAKKFTIVGLWGSYILKPPSSHYPQLPEVEDLTMHLASISRINVVPHCLIRLKSGTLAYLTKRIDRAGMRKLHMEDMCQLTERLTEEKYNGSYEQIAKVIMKYSSNPGLDVVNFYEQVLFSFLTGNADMHLKNFSLINEPGKGYILSPAYDMVSTALVNVKDDEDLALTLNGKKKKIGRKDFIAAFTLSNLGPKQADNILGKMKRAKFKWMEFIEISFLNDRTKEVMKNLIEERFMRL